MSYCTVMCVPHVLHVVVLCVETVLLYATMCHQHGLPRVQVTHISTAKHACTPSEGGAYLIATRNGMFVPHYHGLDICVHQSYTYQYLRLAYIIEAHIYPYTSTHIHICHGLYICVYAYLCASIYVYISKYLY